MEVESMNQQTPGKTVDSSVTRRRFLQTSAVAGAATVMTQSLPSSFGQADSDILKVGVIGCGGRGTGAAKNIVEASPKTRIVALGDAFEDHLKSSYENLMKDEVISPSVKVPEEARFVGFDAFEKVIASDVDIVILATPPHFRPQHFAAAVDAGKHVFCEKPVATDPFGIRSFIASAEKAKEKGLSVVAGTQRRHQDHYLEAMKVIHSGQLGGVRNLHAYWNGGPLWKFPKEEGWTDMEWQMRNWYYYTWLCGDHIVEQHVHNIDVCNWAMKDAVPVKCFGMGGREVRTDPVYGEIYDHHAVVFEYEDGTLLTSTCRQMANCKNDVREVVVCEKGVAHLDGGAAKLTGAVEKEWRDSPNPYVQEHVDLINSITGGQPINEGVQVARSTLCAIMGRMATYTGKEVTWDFAMNSELKLGPESYGWDVKPPEPDVAVPGKTPLV
jgi:predicted dehydrogenase